MSKLHFEAAAKQVRGSNYESWMKLTIALQFVDFFKPFNPRFDAQKFLKACGV